MKINIITTLTITIQLIVLLNISCKDSSVGVNELATNSFFVKLVVTDQNGQPVRGLRVSIYNDPDSVTLQKREVVENTPKIMSATNINFGIKEGSKITLAIYELDGRIVQNLQTAKYLNAGVYDDVISMNTTNVGTRVYKGILTAVNDTTNQVLFKDSIYITLWQSDPDYSVLGYTSNTGTFETTDSLSFPNVLTLPPMIRTSNSPDPISVFSFPQSVVITLTDTVTSKSKSYIRQVVKGQNEFNLSWNPSTTTSNNQAVFLSEGHMNCLSTDTVIMPQTQWRLSQNYPNPFN